MKRHYLLVPAFLALTACNRGNVAGQVVDRDGKPVSGVKVNVLGNTTKTDGKGRFEVKRIRDMPGKRVVVYLYKDGYFDYEGGQRVVEGSAFIKVAMTPREKVATVDAGAGSTIEHDTLTVTTPAGGFVSARDGSEVEGEVSLFLGMMNPDREGFAEAMPGRDFTARDGREGVLSSAGAFVLEAEDENGDPVEIEEPIEVCLDIPASMLAVAPETMPLWQLSDGTWVEVATATRVGDQYCFALVGTGSLNCDLFSRTAAIQGTVCGRDGEPAGAGEPVRVFQNTTYTDENGQYAALVPACYNFIARNKLEELQVPGIPPSMTRVVDFRCPSDDANDGLGDSGLIGSPGSQSGADPFASSTGGAGANNSSGSRDNDPFANTATTGRTKGESTEPRPTTLHPESIQEPVSHEPDEGWLATAWQYTVVTGRALADIAFDSLRPMARGDSGQFGGDTGGAGDSGRASTDTSSNSGGGGGSGFAGPDDVCTSGSDAFVQQAAGSSGQIECDGVSEAGDDTPFSRTVTLDSTSGSVTLNYEHYSVPDRTIVSYEGIAIIDTGCASGSGSPSGSYSGQSSFLTVAVIPGCGDTSNSGTSWDFRLGCN